MRFKTDIKNPRIFSKLTAAIGSLEKIAWVRLDDSLIRITVIPDLGTQVWASLSTDLIFSSYTIQSTEPHNTIDLELPTGPLQRALKSAAGLQAVGTTLRLTKKNGETVLRMTVTMAGGVGSGIARGTTGGAGGEDEEEDWRGDGVQVGLRREKEKIVMQDIPVRVLRPASVETIMQPTVREPDVPIQLPPLLQLKAISDRFTRLAAGTSSGSGSGASGAVGGPGKAARLIISANMYGGLRLKVATEGSTICSEWMDLENPVMDEEQLGMPLAEHPSTKFREAGPDKWATVVVDGRDWSKVLSVGRLEGRVIGCFTDDHALILYVYVRHAEEPSDESVITVSTEEEDCHLVNVRSGRGC